MNFRIFLAALLCVPFSASALTPPPPTIDASSYALMDYQSGQLIAALEPDKKVEPASVTKVMTVYVVLDEIKRGKIKLSDEVLISENAWKRGDESRMFVLVGTRVKVEDLLRGVIIQSGNDAAVALAEYLAGSEEVFGSLMNEYAKKLGMKNSHFVDASGMPAAEHYTTAHDLVILASALIRDFPEEYKIFAEREYTYNNIRQPNRNILLNMDPSVDGMKTGHTSSAGYCLLASAVRDGRRLISAVMGTKSTKYRARASLELLNYGFRFSETVPMFGPAKPVASVRVWKAAEKEFPVGVVKPMYFTVPRDESKRLTVTTDLAAQAIAPVTAGQSFGKVTVNLDGKPLKTVPAVALKAVEKGTLTQQAIDTIRLWIGR